ncbi:Aste57867_3439 [Aphanomyces stellatus]|uniref:Aste57867_3439 protein n=1 Tax=Aphanomyces stellatus TaxID=120398 RepID=A0A485K9N5_9STRA|nr:hypothetical protein As57867_003429 [Aphanomyces stellatus]VFT80605.1 Aste57867_3439 [Aphanomyces stellatus]
MRFEVGAVVKVFLHDGGGGGGVHCRAVVVGKLDDQELVEIVPAKGVCVVRTRTPALCSVFLDDRAMVHFYTDTTMSSALAACVAEFMHLQIDERKMFQQELLLHRTRQQSMAPVAG